jgi:hypothetical protein
MDFPRFFQELLWRTMFCLTAQHSMPLGVWDMYYNIWRGVLSILRTFVTPKEIISFHGNPTGHVS